ncbi:hypothetical protein J1605_018821 [Eschrichtius robustus]|uniref:Cytidyltransferase-like domain-containing protein n=1 Tax=Eschrichtius robustus TaxID=9764 RepID=A0AB34HRL3_ESCRO|nr:hypothetical protein J1605_018821 [Eschrichtius robustus]
MSVKLNKARRIETQKERRPLDQREGPTRTMTETTKTHVILLACGSFNPITKGHIQMFERDGVSGGSWLLAGIQTWQGKGDRRLPEVSGHRWVNGGASLLLQEDPKARGLARSDPEGGTRRSLQKQELRSYKSGCFSSGNERNEKRKASGLGMDE